MTVRALGPIAGMALLAAGCTYARGAGKPERLAAGRPEFAPGLSEGYWIWEDRDGWHLRTTSDVRRRFHGAVEPVGGSISAVRAVGAGPEALARGGAGDRVEFSWEGDGGAQGLDWRASSGCTRFTLYIDGDTRPFRVFLGGPGETPDHIPFAVCRAD